MAGDRLPARFRSAPPSLWHSLARSRDQHTGRGGRRARDFDTMSHYGSSEPLSPRVPQKRRGSITALSFFLRQILRQCEVGSRWYP